MATYLLFWNPNDWPHANIIRMLKAMESSPERTHSEAWRFMSHKSGKAGDEVLLFKSGASPRGVFGHGFLEGEARKGAAGNGKVQWMFPVRFDVLVDPLEEFLISEAKLKEVSGWATQRGSGNAPLAESVAKALRGLMEQLGIQPIQQAVAQWKKQTQSLLETVRTQIVSQRIGQDIFRKNLIEYWQGRCCISGLAQTELLRASHIRAWAKCENDNQRLDVYNGLLLAAHLDAAFDVGLITLNEDGVVRTSPVLTKETKRHLGIETSTKVKGLTARHKAYLEWHRRERFVRK